jgi:hypothetical protein
MSEWRPVWAFGLGVDPTLDWGALNEFKRSGDDAVHKFRLRDTHAAFNIAGGLLWRPVHDA